MFQMRGHPGMRQLWEPLRRGKRQVVPVSRVAFKTRDVSNHIDAQLGPYLRGFLSVEALEHDVLARLIRRVKRAELSTLTSARSRLNHILVAYESARTA